MSSLAQFIIVLGDLKIAYEYFRYLTPTDLYNGQVTILTRPEVNYIKNMIDAICRVLCAETLNLTPILPVYDDKIERCHFHVGS